MNRPYSSANSLNSYIWPNQAIDGRMLTSSCYAVELLIILIDGAIQVLRNADGDGGGGVKLPEKNVTKV